MYIYFEFFVNKLVLLKGGINKYFYINIQEVDKINIKFLEFIS